LHRLLLAGRCRLARRHRNDRNARAPAAAGELDEARDERVRLGSAADDEQMTGWALLDDRERRGKKDESPEEID